MEWGADNTICKFEHAAECEASVPPHFAGWVTFRFAGGVDLAPKDPTCDEERYVLMLRPVEGMRWGRRRGLEDFAVRCWALEGDDAYTTEPDLHLFRVHPRPPYGEAENAVNGRNRRFSTNPVNMWISKRGEPLPQALTLDFGEARTFNEVRIAFDTLYRAYRDMPFDHEDRDVAGMCVRDYDVEVQEGDAWRRVVSVEGNYRRFRTHDFERVKARKLRLVVRATEEEGWGARVYEVRVYDVEGRREAAEVRREAGEVSRFRERAERRQAKAEPRKREEVQEFAV